MLWTRAHASISIGTGISVLLRAAGLLLAARAGQLLSADRITVWIAKEE
jgi:hypothetical protein